MLGGGSQMPGKSFTLLQPHPTTICFSNSYPMSVCCYNPHAIVLWFYNPLRPPRHSLQYWKLTNSTELFFAHTIIWLNTCKIISTSQVSNDLPHHGTYFPHGVNKITLVKLTMCFYNIPIRGWYFITHLSEDCVFLWPTPSPFGDGLFI